MKKALSTLMVLLVLSSGQIFAQQLNADPDKSEILWTAKKVGGGHDGNVKLKSGFLTLKKDKVVGGEFVVDLTSITNNDIQSDEYRTKLLGHLKSDDFFSVASYPEASLKITKVNIYSDNKAEVTANLTIKGKTHPVNFTVEKVDNYYRSRISVDRSRYDVRYGSNSFFANLGDKAIEDIFTLDVKLAVK